MKIKQTILILLAMCITACSAIPSFYDDNESKAAVDVIVAIDNLNCRSNDVNDQLQNIIKKTMWLKTYSLLKGSDDVVELVETLQQSLAGLNSQAPIIRVNYCKLKRESLIKQSETVAKAILGRY